jgi:hypothetical protein
MVDESSFVPILADILCRLCSNIVDKKERENCIKRFCAGTVKFSTSADIIGTNELSSTISSRFIILVIAPIEFGVLF